MYGKSMIKKILSETHLKYTYSLISGTQAKENLSSLEVFNQYFITLILTSDNMILTLRKKIEKCLKKLMGLRINPSLKKSNGLKMRKEI